MWPAGTVSWASVPTNTCSTDRHAALLCGKGYKQCRPQQRGARRPAADADAGAGLPKCNTAQECNMREPRMRPAHLSSATMSAKVGRSSMLSAQHRLHATGRPCSGVQGSPCTHAAAGWLSAAAAPPGAAQTARHGTPHAEACPAASRRAPRRCMQAGRLCQAAEQPARDIACLFQACMPPAAPSPHQRLVGVQPGKRGGAGARQQLPWRRLKHGSIHQLVHQLRQREWGAGRTSMRVCRGMRVWWWWAGSSGSEIPNTQAGRQEGGARAAQPCLPGGDVCVDPLQLPSQQLPQHLGRAGRKWRQGRQRQGAPRSARQWRRESGRAAACCMCGPTGTPHQPATTQPQLSQPQLSQPSAGGSGTRASWQQQRLQPGGSACSPASPLRRRTRLRRGWHARRAAPLAPASAGSWRRGRRSGGRLAGCGRG